MTTNIQANVNKTVWVGHQNRIQIDNGNFRWLTYCTIHHEFMGHENRRTALDWASAPGDWCEKCDQTI